MTRAILLSGGMDSTALAWWKEPAVAYTIDYGQASALGELRAAEVIASIIGMDHVVIRVNCSDLGSGDLCGRPPLDIAPIREWWPFRNQLLLTLAGMRAVAVGVKELMLATVKTDGSHRDGTRQFVTAMDEAMRLQEGDLRVSAPALEMSSSDLIKASGIPHHVLAWSHSCHSDIYACGRCRGCMKHQYVTEEVLGVGY